MQGDPKQWHPFRSAESRDRYYAHYDEVEAACAVPSEVHMVHTDYAETLVRVSGPPDAPPLVIIPGTWAHSLDFPLPLLEPFSASYRLYRLDDPWDVGRSISTRPQGTPGDTMRWLDQLFDSLGLISGVSLFGTSKGAWRAAEYVLHAPERLAKAVWLSPALVVERASLMAGALSGPFMGRIVLTRSKPAVAGLMRWLQPALERDDPAAFETYVDEIAFSLQCLATIPFDMRPRVFSDAELGGIRVPVLYIAGEDEKLSSVKAAVARLHRVAPRIETAVIPGSGHDAIVTKPEVIAASTLAFLGTWS